MINNKFPENLKKRIILKTISRFLLEKEIILLYGMRQTGKTSLLFLIIDYLLKEHIVDKSQIVYFDLENISDFQKIESLKDFNDFIGILKNEYSINPQKRIFVFIDEIQYLSNPSSFLKYLYDHYSEKIKFVVTGSSSLEIKKKFSDALTGRIFRFEIMPLNYKEFLLFTNNKPNEQSFEQYVLFGGFPAVVLKTQKETKIKLLKEIYSLYVRRDIKDLGKIEDVISFNKLTGILASQIGGLVSEANFANIVGISRPTIKNYLFILQNTFVTDLLLPFYTNPKKEITKTPKIYFKDNGIRNAVIDNFIDLRKRTDAGMLVENAIFSEYKKIDAKINFWRTERKHEVDFLLQKKDEIIPVEVKYQTFKKPTIPINLKIFIQKYQPKKAVILTKNFDYQTIYGQTKIIYWSCWRISELCSYLV